MKLNTSGSSNNKEWGQPPGDNTPPPEVQLKEALSAEEKAPFLNLDVMEEVRQQSRFQ